MEGLFGLLVILYLVGSVVGALIKKAGQGPIMTEPFPDVDKEPDQEALELEERPDPDRPTPEGTWQPVPPIMLDDYRAEPDDDTLPTSVRQGPGADAGEQQAGSFVAVTGEAAAGPGQVEALEPELAGVGEGVSAEWEEWPEEEEEEVDEIGQLHRGRSHGTQVPWPTSANEWQRAFVLSEVLGPPLSKRQRR